MTSERLSVTKELTEIMLTEYLDNLFDTLFSYTIRL